jgi:hypothetical protein
MTPPTTRTWQRAVSKPVSNKGPLHDRKGRLTWEPPIGIEPMTYALRGCNRALLVEPKPCSHRGSRSAGAGDQRLLMVVRGHLGGTATRARATAEPS